MLLVLNRMADLVTSDGDRCDGAFIIYRLRQPYNAVNRVVVVCKSSLNRFNGNIVESVGIQHTPGSFITR